ncbi:unnamed protein product [Allacma fusca]|uniref:Peptidase S1 domain-containing protein n=1 Tax=Allacma fusca TaxID=39272 RepID=A0A8J2L1B7_9HEXA|nr:unnamed protein product [Allacma fusca]
MNTLKFFTSSILCLFLLTPVIVECDNAQSPECGLTEEFNGDVRTRVPWTAAIYFRKGTKSPFQYLVTGVVLGPTTVLTVFGGIYGVPFRGKSMYALPSPENSLVAVGLPSTDLNTRDKETQIAEVEYILPHKDHGPENRLYHFVIYRLKNPLDLKSPYARALCLPHGVENALEPSSSTSGGYITSNFQTLLWRSEIPLVFQESKKNPSLRLQAVNVTSVKASECRSTFRFHYKSNDSFVSCARLSPEDARFNPQTCLTHGSSSVVQVNGRWFLRGILSLVPARKRGFLTCPENTLYYYAKILDSLDWLGKNLKCSSVEFPCHKSGRCVPISSVCNVVQECKDASDEDPVLCSYQHKCVNKHMCGIGGKCVELGNICDGVPDCMDGSDERYLICGSQTSSNSTDTPVNPNLSEREILSVKANNEEPSSVSNCRLPASSEGVVMTCTDQENNEISCTDAAPSSVAHLECAPYYSAKYYKPYLNMTCGLNGLWTTFVPFSCDPNCGILSTIVQGFINGGQPVNRHNAFPWYGALFRRNNGRFEFICGANLIERRIVITAAHCIFKIFSFKYSVGDLKVILAPGSSRYDTNLDDPIAQIFDVTRFWIPPSFNPKSLEGDVALVELNRTVNYGQYIRPVCYLPDLTAENELVGKIAKVAGFGLDETGDISEGLKHATFEIVRAQNCKGRQGDRPSSSVYCAGIFNSTSSSLCIGDSGGGLVFPERKSVSGGIRYVLKGIVSATSNQDNDKCDVPSHGYSIFTVLEGYSSWIMETLESTQEE